jgi:hypothetical protein
MKLRYEPFWTVFLLSLAWCGVGGLPRMIGMIGVKEEYAALMYALDRTILFVFLTTAIYLIFAMFWNANRKNSQE